MVVNRSHGTLYFILCSGMPQHGFLRCNYWNQAGEVWDREDCAGCELTLELRDAITARGEGAWSKSGDEDRNCRLLLVIEVRAESMTTKLTIRNMGKVEISGYQTLFHTYLRVHGALFGRLQRVGVGQLLS